MGAERSIIGLGCVDSKSGGDQGVAVAPVPGANLADVCAGMRSKPVDERVRQRMGWPGGWRKRVDDGTYEREDNVLAEGATMPHVAAFDDDGNAVNTKDFLGKPLVLWFYPKDDTPG